MVSFLSNIDTITNKSSAFNRPPVPSRSVKIEVLILVKEISLILASLSLGDENSCCFKKYFSSG